MENIIQIKPIFKDEFLDHFANGTLKDKLFDCAVDAFKSSGLDFTLLKKYQIKIFSGKRDLLKYRLGFTSLNGNELTQVCRLIEFPFFNERGEINDYYVYEPIPSIDGRKYLQPKCKPAFPYILPEVWEVKNKTNKPIWITEGIKKSLILLQYNRYAISLSGVWNFKPSSKSVDEIPYFFEELESFKWDGRTTYLGFDSDLWTNPNVRYALYELAFKLFTKGACLRIATWKNGKGIDDHLFKQDEPVTALHEIENKAISLFDFISADHNKEVVRALGTIDINDDVMLSRILKDVSSKLKITKTELKKAIERKKKINEENVKFKPDAIKTILDFVRLGNNKVKFFNHIESIKDAPDFVNRYAINPLDDVPKRDGYNPLTEAKIFMAGLHIIFYGEQLYLYQDGWYQPFKERYFLKLIELQINEPFKAETMKSKEILTVLKNHLQKKDSHAESSQLNKESHLLNVKNGILDIKTFKLKPHEPNIVFIYQINASYNPNAKCERFEQFLKEVLVKEEDLATDFDLIRLVQQFIGYILYIGIPFHKCLMLYGQGRNGKSILIFVINKLLKRLCSYVHFEEIGIDRFATSDLVGKLVNVSSELNVSARLQDGEVKKIIAGDELRAQRKNQPAFDFRPLAKHIICTNNLPRSKDKSLGYFSRFMIVPFHRIYLPPEEFDLVKDENVKKYCAIQDEFLETKLEKELDGILLWAIYGLKDLLKRRGFCVPEQVQKLKKIFELRSTSVEKFFEDIVDESDSSKNTGLQALYKRYIEYCKQYKIPPESNKKFPSSIRELGYEVDKGSGNKTVVRGICLQDNSYPSYPC